ncbi:hypothetical protein DFH09DRAFT_1191985 [Mycena vulgaris]|nr:hypothetical protein DFH09DRAFT_1191985 [Mycena vulgaris]
MARRKKGAPSSHSRNSLLIKGNGPLLDLPFDILLEILKMLHPLDLLYLSRTNKTLREFLLDRNNISIWRTSFELAEGSPPKCPPYSCEPQWARLLFEPVCHVCLSALEHDFLSDPIWWEFSARYCSECCSDQILERLPKKLTNTSGTRYHNYRPGWAAVFPCIQGYYLAKDVDEFMAKYAVLTTENEKAALIQERREQTKIISDYARLCRPWMNGIVQTETAAQIVVKKARWTAISTKLHEAGWPELLSRFVKDSDLVTIPQPLNDTEWDRIGPTLIAQLEVSVKGSVLSKRFQALNQALPNLSHLTEELAFRPRIVDVALLPDVRALLESDLKVDLKQADIKAALVPKLPELLARWSSSFEEQLRDHTRAALKLPSGSTIDPLGHSLAYFTCTNKCCQGHLNGQWEACPAPWWKSNEVETYTKHATTEYNRIPCTVGSMFNLGRGRAVLEDVIKLYGKDPDITTCQQMDSAAGKLWCMRCTAVNQPTGWRDAPAHVTKFHEKSSSLRPRWEVEIETEPSE